MGRSIPSITYRLESKLSQWNEAAKTLPEPERKAFLELVSLVKNRRTAIDATDEPDLSVAVLLVLLLHLKGEVNVLRDSAGSKTGLEDGLSGA